MIAYETDISEVNDDELASRAEVHGLAVRPQHMIGDAGIEVDPEVISIAIPVHYETTTNFFGTYTSEGEHVFAHIGRRPTGGKVLRIYRSGTGIIIAVPLVCFAIFLFIWLFEWRLGRVCEYDTAIFLGIIGFTVVAQGLCCLLLLYFRRLNRVTGIMKLFATDLKGESQAVEESPDP